MGRGAGVLKPLASPSDSDLRTPTRNNAQGHLIQAHLGTVSCSDIMHITDRAVSWDATSRFEILAREKKWQPWHPQCPVPRPPRNKALLLWHHWAITSSTTVLAASNMCAALQLFSGVPCIVFLPCTAFWNHHAIFFLCVWLQRKLKKRAESLCLLKRWTTARETDNSHET